MLVVPAPPRVLPSPYEGNCLDFRFPLTRARLVSLPFMIMGGFALNTNDFGFYTTVNNSEILEILLIWIETLTVLIPSESVAVWCCWAWEQGWFFASVRPGCFAWRLYYVELYRLRGKELELTNLHWRLRLLHLLLGQFTLCLKDLLVEGFDFHLYWVVWIMGCLERFIWILHSNPLILGHSFIRIEELLYLPSWWLELLV